MSTDRRERLVEIARLFTRLGFTAFGGPAVHVAMMEDEVVTKRRWMDRQHFLDLLASVNFIPGPNSTELAIHVGLVRGGFMGLALAGFCFIVPAVLIILPIAFLYVHYGTLPQVQPIMQGIGAVIVAIVAVVVLRLYKTTLKNAQTVLLAAMGVTLSLLAWTHHGPRVMQQQPELLSLAIAAVIGIATSKRPVALPALLPPLPLASVPASGVGAMALFFLKIGATLFGSGYVLISYLQSGLVDERHWLTPQQLLDAIAVGQFTPGPVLTTATFIGFVLGENQFHMGTAGAIGCAVLATAAIFAPSFVFVAMLGPVLARIRNHPAARGALDAMNAVVAGLITAVVGRLSVASFYSTQHVNWIHVGIAVVSSLAIWRGINATWLIVAGGLAGWIAG